MNHPYAIGKCHRWKQSYGYNFSCLPKRKSAQFFHKFYKIHSGLLWMMNVIPQNFLASMWNLMREICDPCTSKYFWFHAYLGGGFGSS